MDRYYIVSENQEFLELFYFVTLKRFIQKYPFYSKHTVCSIRKFFKKREEFLTAHHLIQELEGTREKWDLSKL